MTITTHPGSAAEPRKAGLGKEQLLTVEERDTFWSCCYEYRGLIYMALSAVGQAFGALFVKFCSSSGMQCFQILFFRGLIMWSSNAFMLIMKGKPFKEWWGQSWEHAMWLILRGLFGFLSLGCKYWSVIHLYLADAISIRFTVHIFSGIFACLMLGESWLIAEAISAFVGFGGILMIVQPAWLKFVGFPAKQGPTYPLFDVTIAILCPVFNALGYVGIRKLKRIKADTDPFVILHYLGMFLTFASLPVARVVEGPLQFPAHLEAWGWLVALSLTTYLSQIFVTWGLQIERAGPATTVTLIGVPSTMLLQAIFLHKEPLSLLSIIGATVICLSIGNVALTKAVVETAPDDSSSPNNTNDFKAATIHRKNGGYGSNTNGDHVENGYRRMKDV